MSQPSLLSLAGVAHLSMIVDDVDAAYARSLLPDYLQLATPPGYRPDRHPLMYSLGTQTVWPLKAPVFKRTYQEAIIGVCSVELKQEAPYRGPYSLMTDVRVNSALAAVLGWLLGYPKTLSRITATDASYRIGSFWRNHELLSSRFNGRGRSFTPSELPHFPRVEPFLAHPIISRTPWGTLLASRFRIDPDTWALTPGEVEAQVPENRLRGLPAGHFTWNGIDKAYPGAFLSQHRWRADAPTRVRS